MTSPGEELGVYAFGEAEAELESLASLPLNQTQANWYARRWAVWFQKRGASVVYRRDIDGETPVRIGAYAFFRPLMDKELVGDVRVSDVGVLIYPKPLVDAGLGWPPRQGDRIVRKPGRADETLYTTIAPPVMIDVSDVNIVLRCVARGV